MKLNARQLKFAELILQGDNQTRAYRKAGYNARGKSAKVAASRLLTNVDLRAYIDRRRSQLIQRLEEETYITKRDVIRALGAIAFSNICDYVIFSSNQLKLKNLDDIPRAKLGAIANLKKNEGGVAIKLYNKIQALTKLAEHLGLFQPPMVDPREHDNNTTIRVIGGKRDYDFSRRAPESLAERKELPRLLK